MEQELIDRFKEDFKRYHRFLCVVYLILNMVVLVVFNDADMSFVKKNYFFCALSGMFVFILILAVYDNGNIKKGLFREIIAYLLIFALSALMLLSDSKIYSFIFLIICVELIFEYGVTDDYFDDFKLGAQTFILGIGFSLELIVISTVTSVLAENVFMTVGMFIVLLGEAAMVTLTNSHIIEFYDEKVFSKSRLLEDVNDTNNKLIDNQEKLNKTNELLGIQKLQLESAYNKINRINSEMLILNNIIKAINEALDINELAKLVTNSIVNDINMDICAIVINSGAINNNDVICVVKSNYSQNFIDDFSEFARKGRFPDKFDSDFTIIDNHVDNSLYYNLNTKVVGSILMIPLKDNQGTLGRLYVGSLKTGFFGEDISFFESIVSQLLIGVKNIRLFATLEDMAVRDGLTGIYNRRFLNNTAEKWVKSVIKDGGSITSVLFDIDKFKRINDSYGHMFGDIVIRGIADSITEIIPKSDSIISARYGGEEFVILFKNGDFEDICTMIQNLHKNIMSKKFIYEGKDIFINVSIGIASYPKTCNDPNAVINRSDRAMYYSKKNGRGRITIDNPEIDKLRR